LTLTLLAPDIVEAIMDGRQPRGLDVHVLREGFPVEWGEQRAMAVRRPLLPKCIHTTVTDPPTARQVC
jgi:hypothetical protein